MNYANKIIEVRKHFGLTQQAFGDSLDVSRHVISQIELGNNKPSLELIRAISKKYHIAYMFFFEVYYTVSDCIEEIVESGSESSSFTNDSQKENSQDDELGKLSDEELEKKFEDKLKTMPENARRTFKELMLVLFNAEREND